MSLDDSQKDLPKLAIERKLENIHDMKSFNDMNIIHDKKVNNISEWNLLLGILNSPKCAKNINSHY